MHSVLGLGPLHLGQDPAQALFLLLQILNRALLLFNNGEQINMLRSLVSPTMVAGWKYEQYWEKLMLSRGIWALYVFILPVGLLWPWRWVGNSRQLSHDLVYQHIITELNRGWRLNGRCVGRLQNPLLPPDAAFDGQIELNRNSELAFSFSFLSAKTASFKR